MARLGKGAPSFLSNSCQRRLNFSAERIKDETSATHQPSRLAIAIVRRPATKSIAGPDKTKRISPTAIVSQNGFTTTRMTMATRISAGTSFSMRQKRELLVLRSAANFFTDAAR